MFYQLFNSLWNMSEVEVWCANTLDYLTTHLFSGGIKGLFAAFSAILQIFSFIADRKPFTPFGAPLDLSGYELVFEDEFEGDSLNTEVWAERGKGAVEYGFYDICQTSVHDGKLYINGSYLENGPQGPGWYTSEISLREHYLYGYFECSCKVNEGNGFWSAFWLQHPNSGSKASEGGIYGTEIDIMESCANNSYIAKDKNCVIQCMHVNGGTGDETEDVDTTGAIFVNGGKGTDVYKDFIRYGVKWTPEEYIFYVNGVETWRSSWRDGTSTVPEEVILSMCIPPYSLDSHAKDYKVTFTVDNVKIYQLKAE